MCPCPSAWETESPGQEGRGQPEGPQEVGGRPPRAGPGRVSAEPMRCALGWAIGGGREQVKAGKMAAQLAGTSRAKVWKPGGGWEGGSRGRGQMCAYGRFRLCAETNTTLYSSYPPIKKETVRNRSGESGERGLKTEGSGRVTSPS